MATRYARSLFKLADILTRHRDLNGQGRPGGPPISRPLWELAVGSRIAARAQPVKLDRGVLLVRVTNTSWANELSLLSEEIRRQLAAQGVRVNALRFAVGKLDENHSEQKARPARPKPPADVAAPANVLERAETLVDTDLRSAVERAAAGALWLNEHNPPE